MNEEALSTFEAAARCGVHYTTIRRWILQGSLSAFETPGGHLRILTRDLTEFIAAHKIAPRKRPSYAIRVLVVDDDPAFLDSAFDFLSKNARLRVRCANGGFLAGQLAAEFQPDVVVLDLIMPGLDGFEACRLIRRSPRSRHARILVLTGYPSDENIHRAKMCGADVCLAKPLGLDELEQVIVRLARGHAGGDGDEAAEAPPVATSRLDADEGT